MKSKSAEKVKLKSFDDLFGVAETVAGEGEMVTSVPLNQLHTFKDHPFRVLDDEKMQETVDSVKRYGVLIPGIVRPHPENGYEVVAGHGEWSVRLSETVVFERDSLWDTEDVPVGCSKRI